MDQAEVEKRVQELRKKDPLMFSHPELKPNEVCLGFVGPEIIHHDLAHWHSIGVPSARRSEGATPKRFGGVMLNVPAILVDVYEFCRLEPKRKPKRR